MSKDTQKIELQILNSNHFHHEKINQPQSTIQDSGFNIIHYSLSIKHFEHSETRICRELKIKKHGENRKCYFFPFSFSASLSDSIII